MAAFGKYQVLEQIGQGGFGRVYRGYDPVLKRTVAIKTCTLETPELRDRFIREAEIVAGLSHPNIVTIYDFGEGDGEPYLVQEYLEGEDLDAKIERGDAIPLATKVDWLVQVAEGLRHAHAHGVVHRDVKPANVRITPDGRVRIMDFGIAKLIEAERQLTQVGMSVGTAGYLSPEQLMAQEVDQRADIFSFGVLAYELVSYRRPFQADSISAIFYRIAHEQPTPVREISPECPPQLAACIGRCLEKDRDDRFADLGDAIAELKGVAAALQSTDKAPPPAAPNPPAPVEARRRRWRALRSPAAWGLATAAVAVGVWGVLAVSRSAESLPSEASGAAPDAAAGAPSTTAAEQTPTAAASARPDARLAAAPTASVPTAAAAPAAFAKPLNEATILVLVRGEGDAPADAAEAALMGRLGDSGRDVVDANAPGAGGADVASLGRRGGARVVVLADLQTQAVASVGGFYSGSATMVVRVYDAASSRLLGTATQRVGGGGVPAKLAADPLQARTAAATQAANRAALEVLRLTRGP